ncbi:hypothetical protein [Halorussus salinus]|uniref:hypothetical protein n=1 Tax=Halorussus salinus TaxID=1364935 RepID=UPI0010924583|nr:hypothetical protein [Halorussus salinus]
MVVRLALLAIGLLEALYPRRVVDFWMNLAAEEGDVELRPWVYRVARLEGISIVLWVLARRVRGGRAEQDIEATAAEQ